MSMAPSCATALLVASSVLRAPAALAAAIPWQTRMLAQRALGGAGPGWRLARWLAAHCGGRQLLALLERALAPGLCLHHCQRKAWIALRADRLAACLRGADVLGAGFDGLASHLCERHPGLQVREFDQPGVQAIKRRHAASLQPGRSPALIPLDLRTHVHPAAPATLVVAEGVAMYLPRARAWRLLRQLAADAATAGAPSWLLFTALAPEDAAGRGFRRPSRMRAAWLQARGEPFRWRADPALLRRLAARAGWCCIEQWSGSGFGEYALVLRSQSSANDCRAAAMVASTSAAVCAAETNPASNAEGAR